MSEFEVFIISVVQVVVEHPFSVLLMLACFVGILSQATCQ